MITSIEELRQRTWDFALTVATVVLLAALGLQSFIGTIVVWVSSRTIEGWQSSPAYTDYVNVMNQIAAPMIVLLVVVMGLCVPKRLFSRTLLIAVSFAMVCVGVVAGFVTHSLAMGLALYLVLSAAIQLAVVVLTVAGVRGPSYLTEGRLVKIGSGLLHLGFIVFAIVVVALQKSDFMLPTFWASAILVTVGTALAFWANPVAWHRNRETREVAIDWSTPAAHEDADAAELTAQDSEVEVVDERVEVADAVDLLGDDVFREDEPGA